MYPFRIRISIGKEPEIVKIYQRLHQNQGRLIHIPNNSKTLSTKITHQLKPIRPDVFLGRDSRYKDSYIGLKPGVSLEMIPINKDKTVFDLMFKKLF